MRTLLPWGLTLALAAGAQQDGRVRAGEEQPQPQRGEIHAIADLAPSRNCAARRTRSLRVKWKPIRRA